MSLPRPVALTPCLPTELLSYVLEQTYPATLIICGSREAFLSSLLEGTSYPPVQPPVREESAEPASSQPSSSSDPNESSILDLQPEEPPQPRHPLLRATLHQISLSRKIITAFIPTVSHLRAYLSALSMPAPQTRATPLYAGKQGLHGGGTAAAHPLLVVYGLVTLHYGTSEWSTQGLGLTCAAAAEVGMRCVRRVVLVEPLPERTAQQEKEGEEDAGGVGDGGGGGRTEAPDDDCDGDGADETGEDNDEGRLEREQELRNRYLQGIWHEKLPILSGSVRRAGAAGLEYGGRTVEVGMVLRRWFVFERGVWEDNHRI